MTALPLPPYHPDEVLPKTLPMPPAGAALVIRASNDPATSLADMARLIEREPSLTVNLLRLANSAAYGNGRQIRSVGQATMLLGARTIRNLAVAHVVTSLLAHLDPCGLDAELFWEDSLRRACAALVLARTAGYEDPSEAFTVGLVQDLGVLVMAMGHPSYGAPLNAMRGDPGSERVQREEELTGKNHAQVFMALAKAWELPGDLTDAVAFHHGDGAPRGNDRVRRLTLLARAADVVADVTQAQGRGDTLRRAKEVLAQIESRRSLDLEVIIDAVADEMEVQSEGLEIHIGAQPSFEALVHGANEALVQISYSYEELTQRLEQLLREKDELARQLAASNAALQRLATTDPLTDVANRRAFSLALERTFESGAEGGEPVSLILLDLDKFKRINDTFGHQCGDDVLKAVAERLCRSVRPDDLVGRIGGEEFGILLPRCNGSDGALVAERLRAEVAAEPVLCRDGCVLHVTASFGGVTMTSASADEAIRLADKAMYRSKERGRNRVSWIEDRARMAPMAPAAGRRSAT